MTDHYRIPLNTTLLMSGKHRALLQEDIRVAIHQNINLLLKSFQLSYRFDPFFGCVVDKYQGATPPQRQSEKRWREGIRLDIQQNLLALLQRYETRIKVDDVIVRMITPKMSSKSAVVKISVQIKGQLTLGRKEHFYYPDSEVDKDALEVLPLVIPVGKK